MAFEPLTVTTPDGVVDCYLHRPPDDGRERHKVVLFYMDGPGIRPALHDMADRLASLGCLVLLPNLFYRTGPFAPFDAGTVFDEGPERERIMGLIRSIDRDQIMRDTGAFLEVLGRDARADLTSVGCVGYCMGGKFALAAAGTFPDVVSAAASIHGGGLATDRADSPHHLAPRMRARVYVGVAEIDRGFTSVERERLHAALDDAGVVNTIEVYQGARHGFAVPDMAVYEQPAADHHWRRLAELFSA